MTVIPECVQNMVSGMHLFNEVLNDMEADWSPDPVPIVFAMANIGRELAAHANQMEVDHLTLVLDRLEHLLIHGTELEKDAAATGFIEAVSNVLVERPEVRWLLKHFGQESEAYLEAWNRFCGVSYNPNEGNADSDIR